MSAFPFSNLLPFLHISTLGDFMKVSKTTKTEVENYCNDKSRKEFDEFFELLKEFTCCSLHLSKELTYFQVLEIRKLDTLFSHQATRGEKITQILPRLSKLEKVFQKVATPELIDCFSVLTTQFDGSTTSNFGFGWSSFGSSSGQSVKQVEYNQYLQTLTQKVNQLNGQVTDMVAYEDKMREYMEFYFSNKGNCYLFERFLEDFSWTKDDYVSLYNGIVPMALKARLRDCRKPNVKSLTIGKCEGLLVKGDHVKMFSSALESSPNITCLNMSGQVYLDSLLKVLSCSKHIETLSLGATILKTDKFSSQDFNFPNLKSITFTSASFSGWGGSSHNQGTEKALYPLLKCCPKLELLAIENEINRDLCDFLESTKSLKSLSFTAHTFNVTFLSWSDFCISIGKNTSITSITLKIGESIIKKMVTLTGPGERINLKKDLVAMEYLFEGLSKIPTLTTLVLSCPLKNEIVLAVSKLLELKKIKHLSLGESRPPKKSVALEFPKISCELESLTIESSLRDHIPHILESFTTICITIPSNLFDCIKLINKPLLKISPTYGSSFHNAILALNSNSSIKKVIFDSPIDLDCVTLLAGLVLRKTTIPMQIVGYTSSKVKNPPNTFFDGVKKTDVFPAAFYSYEDRRITNYSNGFGISQPWVFDAAEVIKIEESPLQELMKLEKSQDVNLFELFNTISN